MSDRTFLKAVPAFTMLAGTTSTLAQNLEPITPVKPQKDGGKSVLAASQKRRTNRDISDEKLPPQVLSNLLWAAFGVNREKGSFGKPGRTVASASNSQEIDLYVATGLIAANVYLFAASQGLAAHFHNCDKQNTHTETSSYARTACSLRPDSRLSSGESVRTPRKYELTIGHDRAYLYSNLGFRW